MILRYYHRYYCRYYMILIRRLTSAASSTYSVTDRGKSPTCLSERTSLDITNCLHLHITQQRKRGSFCYLPLDTRDLLPYSRLRNRLPRRRRCRLLGGGANFLGGGADFHRMLLVERPPLDCENRPIDAELRTFRKRYLRTNSG